MKRKFEVPAEKVFDAWTKREKCIKEMDVHHGAYE